jgi:glycosyltransferase involved in cell wall biosynthesis
VPAASIILNSYNQEAFVADAIESALGQTMDDLELLIVDNGSTDSSPDIIRRYADDPRVRLHLQPDNRAITQRFNAAVDAAAGKYVSFLYSDDLLLPRKLEVQLAAFAAGDEQTGVVYGPARGLNVQTGAEWTYGSPRASGWIFDRMLRDHFAGQIDMVSPLIRRDCLLQHRFYEDVFAEGEGIFFRIALTHRFEHLDEPLVVLRDHGANAGKAVRRNAEMTMVMLDRLAVHPDLPEASRPEVERFQARLLRGYAWQAARLGEEALFVRESLARAARLDRRTALSARSAAALALAHLPAGLRRSANRVATRLRRDPSNAVLVGGFGGGDS